MILNEVQGEESADGSALNVSACVERVTQAVDGFIRVGQDQIHHSSDPVIRLLVWSLIMCLNRLV